MDETIGGNGKILKSQENEADLQLPMMMDRDRNEKRAMSHFLKTPGSRDTPAGEQTPVPQAGTTPRKMKSGCKPHQNYYQTFSKDGTC